MSNVCNCSASGKNNGEVSCYTLLSHSNLFGPSLDEVIIHFCSSFLTNFAKKLGITHSQNVTKRSHCQSGDRLNLDLWLSQETTALANELLNLGMDAREPGDFTPTPSMLSTRRYVLRRLAELMAKKEELELAR